MCYSRDGGTNLRPAIHSSRLGPGTPHSPGSCTQAKRILLMIYNPWKFLDAIRSFHVPIHSCNQTLEPRYAKPITNHLCRLSSFYHAARPCKCMTLLLMHLFLLIFSQRSQKLD